ncbi:hypothetical protein QW180_31390 [Vibrio sinaloensis]|nr:hypothetical protein [Vibrio sinaloensis]
MRAALIFELDNIKKTAQREQESQMEELKRQLQDKLAEVDALSEELKSQAAATATESKKQHCQHSAT